MGHKMLNTLKKKEIISSIFSHLNILNLEIDNGRKIGKFTNMWELNNMFLKKGDQRRIQKENLKILCEKWKTECTKT